MEMERLPVLFMQACMTFQSHPYLAIDNRKSRKVIESGKQPFESLHFGRKPSISFLPSPDFRDGVSCKALTTYNRTLYRGLHAVH
jgi:hypothetical protein